MPAGPLEEGAPSTTCSLIEGRLSRGTILKATPAKDLQPPPVLYRGADESRASRWSWTTDLASAQMYAKAFGRDNQVWTCIPQRIFGRVDLIIPEMPGANVWPSHTEWLLIPEQVWLVSRPQDDPRRQQAITFD